MLRTFQIALLSTTLVIACKSADKRPEAKADQPPAAAAPVGSAAAAATPPDPAARPAAPGTNSELEAKGIAMMQRMGDMFAAAAGDCEKLAKDLRAFIAENRALIGELMANEKTQTEEQIAAFETRNQAVRDAVMTKMGPAIAACEANPNVQAAMKDFPTN